MIILAVVSEVASSYTKKKIESADIRRNIRAICLLNTKIITHLSLTVY